MINLPPYLQNLRMQLFLKRRKHSRTLRIFTIGVILVGLLFLLFALPPLLTPAPANVSETPVDALEERQAYHFDQCAVLDVCGHATFDALLNMYRFAPLAPGEAAAMTDHLLRDPVLLIRFSDQGGRGCYAALKLEGYSNLLEASRQYVQGPLTAEGLPISPILHGYSLGPGSQADAVEAAFRHYAGGTDATLVDLVFYLEAESMADFRGHLLKEVLLFGCLSLCILLPGCIGLVYTLWQDQKLRRAEQAADPDAHALADLIRRRWQTAERWRTALLLCAAVSIALLLANAFGAPLPAWLPGMSVMLPACAGCVYLLYARPILRRRRMLEQEGIDHAALIHDLECAVSAADQIRCGRQVLVLPGPCAIPVSQIKWIYIALRSKYEAMSHEERIRRYEAGKDPDAELIVRTPAGQTHTFPLELSVLGEVIMETMQQSPAGLPQDLLVGYSEENAKAYKAFLRNQKA